jgi:hypothetical protein
MTRVFCAALLLAAALGAGCSGSESASTPTAPTTTSSTSSGGSNPPPTQSCLPAAPGNLKVTVSNSSTRVFTWSSVANAQDYFIQIAQVNHEDYLVNTNTTQTTYTWAGNAPGSYWARVYARNSCGSGPNSEQLFFN